jgi:hypothetical protein
VPEESIEVQKTYAKSEIIERPETEGLVDPSEVADLLKPIHPDILDRKTVNAIRNMAMDKMKEAVGQEEKAPVTITKQEFMAQKAAPKKSKKAGTKPPPKKPRPTEKETPEDKLDKALKISKQAKEKQDEIKQLKDKEAAKKQKFFKGLEKEPDEEMVSAEETDRAEQLAILEYLILKDLKVIA